MIPIDIITIKPNTNFFTNLKSLNLKPSHDKMEEKRKLSRYERSALRDDAIKTKMSELDDEESKPFIKIFKKIRHIEAKIDSLETDIAHDCRKASELYDGVLDPRFDIASWVMRKTLDQFKEVEIESLGSVSLKIIELNSKDKEVTKYLEISPLVFFRKMRSGILRNHKKPCIRNSSLPQTKMLKLFMANQRVQLSDDEEKTRNNSEKSNYKNPRKRKRAAAANGRVAKTNNEELMDLMATMEGELLSEIRETKIRLFRAKARCLELGLDVTI